MKNTCGWLENTLNTRNRRFFMVLMRESHSYVLLSQNGKGKTVVAETKVLWEEITEMLMDERDPQVPKTLKSR